MCFESMAQLLSLIPNSIIGIVVYIQLWSTAILNTGVVFRGDDIIWPIRLFYYILPLQYTFNGAAYSLIQPSTFDGAALCAPGATVQTQLGLEACNYNGFYCPNATSPLTCYGRSGLQVLHSLHYIYDTIGDEDKRGLDILLLLAIALVVKLHYFAGVFYLAHSKDSISSPAAAASAAAAASSVADMGPTSSE